MTLRSPDLEPEYFQVSRFGRFLPESVFHGFFGRNGGASCDIYASLNCGRGSGDDPEAVRANLHLVAQEAGVADANLLTLYQIHSDRCLIVEEPWDLEDRPQADAFVTKTPGIALGVLTADCAPVLFYGADADGAPVVGAAHAGWGGAFGGVLEATVVQMGALGVEPQDITAAIGSCIAQDSYEVGPEFYTRFIEADATNERFFIPADVQGSRLFDLPGYCTARLWAAGVKRVFSKALDTYYHEEDFFSYRRTTHRKEPDYGRQISVIAIVR